MNYYAILQVPPTASKDEITAAYRKLSKQYHPDLNPGDTVAEETMKQINLAYAALTTENVSRKRGARASASDVSGGADASARAEAMRQRSEAKAVMEQYFDAISKNDFAHAYELVSDFDKEYVTIRSFEEWRSGVKRVFRLQSFTVSIAEDVLPLSLRKGLTADGKRFTINITELNRTTNETEHYRTQKHCVLEDGKWKVLLGYRDLNEIARVFETISQKHENEEMTQHWETYCNENNRTLGILTRTGLVTAAARETYRAKRYKLPLAICVYRTSLKDADDDDVRLISVARTLKSALRLTDVCAYLGGGVFAVLFVGLKKRDANSVMSRVATRLDPYCKTTHSHTYYTDKLDFEPQLNNLR